MLKRRVDFSMSKLKYGEPVCASPDGLYIIFRRRNLFLAKVAEMNKQNNRIIDLHSRALTFTIMKVTPFKLVPVKHVDVIKGIQSCLDYELA
jgi:hypothetical protein